MFQRLQSTACGIICRLLASGLDVMHTLSSTGRHATVCRCRRSREPYRRDALQWRRA